MKGISNKVFVAMLLVSLVLMTPLAVSIGNSLSSTPIISGYQGLDFIYDSVHFKNYWYTSTTYTNPNYQQPFSGGPYVASAHSFGDRLNLDPDMSDNRMPNLKSEQKGFSVDRQFVGDIYQWQWVDEAQSTSLYTVYKEFQMQEFKATWEMNLWLDGTYDEARPVDDFIWQDAELWIEVVSNNFAYFEDNPNEVYIAPVYVACSNAEWYSGTDNPDESYDPSQGATQDIFPEVRGTALGIYPYRDGTVPQDVEGDALSYQGTNLDPSIFKDTYWLRIGVDRFGVDSEYVLGGLLGWDYAYPSLHLEFEIHVFVVGVWEVTLYGDEIPDLDPHPTDWGETALTALINGFLDFANSPLGWLLGLGGLILFAFVFLVASGALPYILVFILTLSGKKQTSTKTSQPTKTKRKKKDKK